MLLHKGVYKLYEYLFHYTNFVGVKKRKKKIFFYTIKFNFGLITIGTFRQGIFEITSIMNNKDSLRTLGI